MMWREREWIVNPIGDGYWPADHDPRQAVYQQALALIPADATVSASSRFLTHLTHRPEIYFYPNPFRIRGFVCRISRYR